MMVLRHRLEVIEDILEGRKTTGFDASDIETVALQFRMVFETIVMSTLCANRPAFEAVSKRFHREWDARYIVRAVEQLNPHFYPVPHTRQFDENGRDGTVTDRTDSGFLTKSELLSAHGRCGDIVHVRNPYSNHALDLDAWRRTFTAWKSRTLELLKLHRMSMTGTTDQLWTVFRHRYSEPAHVSLFKLVGQR